MEVGGEFSDEVLGEGGYVSGEGHRFPPSGVLAETEAVLAATERRKTGDRFVFVGVDVQMASFGTDADMFVVSQGEWHHTAAVPVGRSVCSSRSACWFSCDTFRKFFELDAGL